MKKLIPILLICLIGSGLAVGQKKILVSPGGDAIPIYKNTSVRETIKRYLAKNVTSAVCTDKATFGFSLDQNPAVNVNHIGFHQDIMAMWYVAPASGTIDTVLWYSSDVGSLDSTVTVRLFESNIYPGSGPGYSGYPKPGRLCWGYYINTNDLDNGVAAFPEDATDTTWFSTVSGATPSFSPMGDEIWGFGGAPKVEQAFAVNYYALGDLGVPNITVGNPFFITIRIYGPHVPQAEEDQTGFYAITEDDSMQTHNWKFYEHIVEIQPGFTCPGWVARGDFNILFWYTMSVTTNIPPTFSNLTNLNNTFSTDPQVIQVVIQDCNPENPLTAGVEWASIRYTLNGTPQPDIPLLYLGADTWEASIPGGSVDDRIAYKVVASDSTGFTDSTGSNQYRIVSLRSEWYTADTGSTCTDQDISATGTLVSNASFFVPPYSGSGTAPMDDGTAGPFDMGSSFMLFGDTFRYAWIGVNGALALSKGATDTLDVNANGYATTFWDFPNAQKSGRTDTAGAGNMPGMFIAPFWADFIVEDTVGTYGAIRYGNNSDSCLFIAEWDSIGAFETTGALDDITTFRAVLNRCDGTVEFQYKSVGTTGLDSAALVGMQADSNAISGPSPGWIYVNRNTYPFESKPRDNWCVKLYPNIGTVALDGWNIVAVSLTPNDGDYSRTSLFPTAVSAAFSYSNGYVPKDSVTKGQGVWLKFNGQGGVGSSPGTFDDDVTATVADKWNLIGGPSSFVPVGSIIATGGTVVSSYYGYGTGGYFVAFQIQPGKGFWVKMDSAGTLQMLSSGAAPKAAASVVGETDLAGLNRVTITDATGRSQSLYLGGEGRIRNELSYFELPPAPPAGSYDVRFSSQRMVESYPDAPVDGRMYEYPIAIQGAAYPVIVHWNISTPVKGARTMVLSDITDGKSVRQVMEGSGSVMIRSENVKNIVIRLSEGVNFPATFALSRNYPNPFNPVTHFTVDLPKTTEVEVAVYDLLGRLITTLLSGTHEAASLVLSWDGRDNGGAVVPTGMYIIRMRADEFTASQKILLMK